MVMTLALSTHPVVHAPVDVLASLHAYVTDWCDLEAVADAAVHLLRTAVPAAAVSIHRYDARAQVLVALATEPREGEEATPGARLLVKEGVLGDAVRKGEIQRAINSYVKPDFVRSLPGQMRSDLAFPIRAGAAVVGVIQLQYAAPHRPGAEDEALASSLALHLAAPFASARPGARSREGNDPRLVQAEALAQLASHVAQNSDLHGVLDRVAATALDLVP
ncbi:MAG: GAF domain-containing protein, partial [Gemmatimonadetes bacterium]|nr:GAF domain-containing protein [Gemmatimonadota bacterium]